MDNSDLIIKVLDKYYPNAYCELNYNYDYELLIAVMLSAQTTDKRVNEVTKKLFKYSLKEIAQLSIKDIESIIHSVGTSNRKALYVHEITNSLLNDCKGIVPNNREYLESLKGVGRKSANVVLSVLFNENVLAVDTHILRISKRLGLTNSNNPLEVESDLIKIFPLNKINQLHHQLIFFGRYKCKSRKPECKDCKLKALCNYNKER